MALRTLCGAAYAALTLAAAPFSAATAQTVQEAGASAYAPAADASVSAFYASRQGAPLWLGQGPDSLAAGTLIAILHRADLDGFASGSELADHAEALLARARAGDPAALTDADQLLSNGWVGYVQALRRAAPGMTYADPSLAPRTPSAAQILKEAAAAPSLAQHIQSVAQVNPIYAELRDAASRELQLSGGGVPDSRILANLDRARAFPASGRYIVVDAAGARLLMIDNGQIADSMKVIVGKPTSQTPMLASMIYYATLNPYWNVPQDLAQRLIAPRVLKQGAAYLKDHHYELLSGFGEDAHLISPGDVDWKAVAAGTEKVRLRQLPGPANSMGRLKFGFANGNGIYLHDSPEKELFAKDDRDLSNGCIRLQDAPRLGRWLMGRDPGADGDEPEQHVLLPTPVPVYITYLTTRVDGGQLTFLDDIYGRDAQGTATMAALR